MHGPCGARLNREIGHIMSVVGRFDLGDLLTVQTYRGHGLADRFLVGIEIVPEMVTCSPPSIIIGWLALLAPCPAKTAVIQKNKVLPRLV